MNGDPAATKALPSHDDLRCALREARRSGGGGFGRHVWATVTDRRGVVKAVAYSGERADDQLPAGRVISAQKAKTAADLSLSAFALSTANLYPQAQPGGALFGLENVKPLDVRVAFGGERARYGTARDFLVGRVPGGASLTAGGVALYDATGEFVGGLGCSGDQACADHNVAWKLRHVLTLDYVPAGVDPIVVPGKPPDDNIVFDVDPASGRSASGWGHPESVGDTKPIALELPHAFPIRVR